MNKKILLTIFSVFIFNLLLVPFALSITDSVKGPISSFFIGPDKKPYKGNILVVYSTGGKKEDVKWLRDLCIEFSDYIKDIKLKKKIKIIRDTDFKEDFFGKFRIELIGPFKHHQVLQKYYNDLPFTIDEKGIYQKTQGPDKGVKPIGVMGSDLSLITIWPQPHKDRGFTVIHTAGTYEALKKTYDGCGAYTDFIIHDANSVKSCQKDSFVLMGNYNKDKDEWSLNSKQVYYPDNAETFFQTIQNQAARNIKRFTKASVRKITFNDGTQLEGKLFRGEDNKAIIKIAPNSKSEKPVFIEKDIGDIESVDSCAHICGMFHNPDLNTELIYSEWSIRDDKNIASILVVDQFNNTGKTFEFIPAVTVEPLESLDDMFGNPLKFKEIKRTHNKYIYRIKLNYPIRKGEKIFIRGTALIKDCIKLTGSTHTLKCDYTYSLTGKPFKLILKIPLKARVLNVYPRASKIITPNGKVLVFQGQMPIGELYSIKVDYQYKK